MSHKTISIGVVVSSHIDIPISVPENLDIKKLNKFQLKEKLSNGDFKCTIEDLQETIQELFEGMEVNPDNIFHYERELNAQSPQVKKMTYVLDETCLKRF
jgi:hypothetical protein